MIKYHIHIITYRASLPIYSYNSLLRFLYNNNIPYITQDKISKTRDDAGLPKYYDRVIFWYKDYIDYKSNRKLLTLEEYLNKIRKMLITQKLSNFNNGNKLWKKT